MYKRQVRGVLARIILGISVLLFAVGTIFKLLGIVLGESYHWLETASLVVTLGGLGATLLIILVMFIMAVRYHRGQPIPAWMESLVSTQ